MATVRADLSQYYAVKALFERILGRAAFVRLKEYAPTSAWRANYLRLLRAIAVAVDATVEVVDAEWRRDVNDLLKHGAERLKVAKSVDELHAVAAATLGELAFLQLGFVPRGHWRVETVPLAQRYWRMNHVRTVQYVQSDEQRATQSRLSRVKARGGDT